MREVAIVQGKDSLLGRLIHCLAEEEQIGRHNFSRVQMETSPASFCLLLFRTQEYHTSFSDDRDSTLPRMFNKTNQLHLTVPNQILSGHFDQKRVGILFTS